MSRRFRNIFISILCIIILIITGYVYLLNRRQPPLEKYQQALNTYEAARSAKTQKSARELLQSAQNYLTAGQQAIRNVNESWWPFLTFALADSLLDKSIQLSQEAISLTGEKQSHLVHQVQSEISKLQDSLEVWQDILNQSLPRTEQDLLFRSASSNLQLGESMFENKQFAAALQYTDKVYNILASLQKHQVQRHQSNRAWIKESVDWLKKTIEQSKNSGKAALIVDKKKHYLFILSAGKIIDSMVCDLGYNSGYQKRMSGDGATPEGMYNVTKVNKFSKYYKALLLNYPNPNDSRRFKSNISAGIIPSNSRIGGLIEIHGHGGAGRDWTDGCVAVTDNEMDTLLRLVSIKTPVTIVREWVRP